MRPPKEELLNIIASVAAVANWDPEKQYLAELSVGRAVHDAKSGKWCANVEDMNEIHDYVSSLFEMYFKFGASKDKVERTSDQSDVAQLLYAQASRYRGLDYPQRFFEYVVERFGEHDDVLERTSSFTSAQASEFAEIMFAYILNNISLMFHPKTIQLPAPKDSSQIVLKPSKEFFDAYRNAIILDVDIMNNYMQIIMPSAYLKVLQFSSVKIEDYNGVESPRGLNTLRLKPIIDFGGIYIIPINQLLAQYLPSALYYHLIKVDEYTGEFGYKFGKSFERIVYNDFVEVFGSVNIQKGIGYLKKNGYPDIDILIKWRDTLLIVECTSKFFTQASWLGDEESALRDLKLSIERCYLQGSRAYKRITSNPEEFGLEQVPKKIGIVVATEAPLPSFLGLFLTENYLKNIIRDDLYPYIIDFFSLRKILRKCYDGSEFIDFLFRRVAMCMNSKNLSGPTEADCFAFYRKYGFKYLEKLTDIGSVFYIGDL